MSLQAKDFLKKYTTLLLFAFICSLFIPLVLYSFESNPLYFNTTPRAYEYPPLVKYSYKWPTIASSSTDLEQQEQQDEIIYKQIDQKYCGQDRCKFLLPVAITEQESKAQLHFRQLAFLAGKIDRTIVLPNVYNSHLGACLPHPFNFYYDETWLNDNKDKFNYITMDKFKEWLLERHYAGVVPTGQDIYIQGSRKSRLLKNIKNCFQDSFDFSGRPTVDYQVVDHTQTGKNMNLTNIMKSILSDEAREHEYLGQSLNGADKNTGSEKQKQKQKQIPPVDVINLFYDRRYKFIDDPKAQQPIPYSKRWVDIAEKISSQLKPYIAIHWRMERLEPVSNLLPCAQGLIDEIHKFDLDFEDKSDSKKKHPNVFLLTDYPHLLNTTGAKPESLSFTKNQLKEEHHEAIKYLYGHLNISLTNIVDNKKIHYDQLPKENWHLLPIDTKGSTDPIDRSVLGIVDKLVAIKAQWFLAGRPGVCAKSSSFTGRISLDRKHAFNKGDDNIIVPIKTFNLKKDEQTNLAL